MNLYLLLHNEYMYIYTSGMQRPQMSASVLQSVEDAGDLGGIIVEGGQKLFRPSALPSFFIVDAQDHRFAPARSPLPFCFYREGLTTSRE